VTVNGRTTVAARLERLELALNARPDPARREAAIDELTKRLTKSLAWLRTGNEPTCLAERVLAARGGNIEAAIVELAAIARRQS
jgi:hypothetical protein